MSKPEQKKVSRRKFIAAGAGVVAVAAAAGAAYYLSQPSPAPAPTPTATPVVTTTETTAAPLPTTTAAPVAISYNTYHLVEVPNVVNAQVNAFNAKYPTIKVEVSGAPFGDYISKLLALLPTPDAPDVFMCTQPGAAFLPYTEPLNDYMKRYNWPVDKIIGQSDVPAVWLKQEGGDDLVHSANWLRTPYGLIIRRDIYEERGIGDPMAEFEKTGDFPKWSYDEYLDIARKCTFKRADGTQVYGHAIPTAPADGVGRSRENWCGDLYSAGGGLVRPDRPGEIICGKEPYLKANVEVSEFARTVVEEKLTPVGIQKPKYIDMMGAGQVAAMSNGPWQFSYDSIKPVLDKMGAMPKPFFGKGWEYYDVIDVMSLQLTKSSQHKDEAFQFITHIMFDQDLVQPYVMGEASFPALRTMPMPDAFYKAYGPAKLWEWLPAQSWAKYGNCSYLPGFMNKEDDMWKAWFDNAINGILHTKDDIQTIWIQLQGQLEKIAAS